MRRKSFLLAAPVAILLLATLPSCRNPFSPIDDLDRIPEKVVIDGTVISMQALVYRDFMPGVEPGGSPLIAVITLAAAGRPDFPDHIGADKIWVSNRRETWESGFQDELRPRSPAEPNIIELVARGGPKWEPETTVDIVVRITVRGGQYLYIKSLNNKVGVVW